MAATRITSTSCTACSAPRRASTAGGARPGAILYFMRSSEYHSLFSRHDPAGPSDEDEQEKEEEEEEEEEEEANVHWYTMLKQSRPRRMCAGTL